MSKLNYKTSKDYKRLKELLDKGYEVVCFTTYDFLYLEPKEHEPLMTTDVCTAKLIESENKEYDMYFIGSRGRGVLHYWPNLRRKQCSFDELCASERIEFIEPNGEEK